MNPFQNALRRSLLPIVVGLALCGCGPKDEMAPKKVDVTAQLAGLKGDENAKTSALTELAAGGPNSVAAVNDIIPLLKDGDPIVRRLAAYALGQIGAGAKAALPALNGTMQDSDPTVVTASLNAVRSISPASVEGLKVDNVMTK